MSIPLQHEPSANLEYTALQIFILIGAVIGESIFSSCSIIIEPVSFLDLGYTTSLLVTAMITVPAYDQDVWVRDIDSSPSPFPISILFSFVFRRHSSSPTALSDTRQTICLPGCNCTVKLHPPTMMMTESIPCHAYDTTGAINSERCRSESLRGTLVQIPSAAERRASIIFAFEVAR